MTLKALVFPIISQDRQPARRLAHGGIDVRLGIAVTKAFAQYAYAKTGKVTTNIGAIVLHLNMALARACRLRLQ